MDIPTSTSGGAMTTIVLIESSGPPATLRAIDEARRAGFDVTFVSRDPAAHPLPDRTGGVRVIGADTDDLPALIDRLRALNTADPVAGVVTADDRYLPTVAAVAEALGLPGADPAAVRICRDKHRTRRALARRAFTPRFAVARTAEEVPAALDRVGLPCVITAVADAAGRGARAVHSYAEALAHARLLTAGTAATPRSGRPSAPPVLVEEFVQGPEFTVETFSQGEEVRVLGVTSTGRTGGPSFVVRQHLFPAPLPPEQHLRLCSTAITAIRAVGLDFGPAHTAIRLTATGPKLIEILPRLGGDRIPELVRLATGVDLAGATLRAATGGPIDLTPTRARAAGIRFLDTDRPGPPNGAGYVLVDAATPAEVPARLDAAVDRVGRTLEHAA